MKKLMMAAAIVCAAAVANAATADWNTGTMYYGGVGTAVGDDTQTQLDDDAYTGYAYLWVLGTSADAKTDYQSLTTAAQILALAQASDFDSITINGHEYSLTDAWETSGGELAFNDGADYKDGEKAYAVVLVQAKDGDDVVAYSANTAEGVFNTSGGGNFSMALNWGAEDSGVATTWQSVPEPTSGLLLLLGVAGLALRRRRA